MVDVKKARCPVCLIEGSRCSYHVPLLRSYIRPSGVLEFTGYLFCPVCKKMYAFGDPRLIREE